MGIGVSKAIYAALEELHTTEKTAENTDQLMVCTVLYAFLPCMESSFSVTNANGCYEG